MKLTMPKTTTTITARVVDAWICREIMGWMCPGPGGDINGAFDQSSGRMYYIGPQRLDPRSTAIEFHPTTDANADAEVRAAVREMDYGGDSETLDSTMQVGSIIICLDKLWSVRRTNKAMHKFAYELPGDWSLAAYAVGNGLDVLEVERMVRK